MVVDVDVDAEDNVGNTLLQIWELTFGSGKILRLDFIQHFAADVL